MAEYIYLLQEREFVISNQKIYKIGQTKQQNLTRLLQYPNGSIVIVHTTSKDCCKTEKLLIQLFKEKFKLRRDIGYEYFEGDSDLMRREINKCIDDEKEPEPDVKPHKEEPKSKVHTCHKSNKNFSHNWCLIRHAEKCKGLKNPRECEYCKKTFKHDRSRFRHYNKCEKKQTIQDD